VVSILLIHCCSMRALRLGPGPPCGTAIREIRFPTPISKLRNLMTIMATSYIGITPAMNSIITQAIPAAAIKRRSTNIVPNTTTLTTLAIGTSSYPPSFLGSLTNSWSSSHARPGTRSANSLTLP
jgi:hypothetical protein